MKNIMLTVFLMISSGTYAALPGSYKELLPYVQQAPNQLETNTCLFQASTGAMELLLNKKHNIKNPKVGGKYDLSESFLIWQRGWSSSENPSYHFIEAAVKSFNHGEAVHNRHWPFVATMEAWNKHPDFDTLPRIEVPQVKTELLFARGRKYATYVLKAQDIEAVKQALVSTKSPVIVNYNDDSYWHVVLIVGYDDSAKGECYQIEKEECNAKGAFYVRDSNGMKYEARAYNWFLIKGNAAASVLLLDQ